MVRPAIAADIPALVAHARAFKAESGLPGTFSEAATRRTLERAIADANWLVLVDDRAEEVRGGAIVAIDGSFTEEPEAYVQAFYVAPRWRGSAVARGLVAEICRLVDSRACVAAFTASNAAISGANDRLFANLFGRYGFRSSGPVLIRRPFPERSTP
jgi:GNAT superfamily N-acetyltransferase